MSGQITWSATLDIKSTAIKESLGTRGALEQGRKHSIKEEQYGWVSSSQETCALFEFEQVACTPRWI